MKVIQIQYTVKRGRTLVVVGYHPERMDLVLEWVEGMCGNLAYLDIQEGVEMPAPYIQRYRVRRTKDRKRWTVGGVLPF